MLTSGMTASELRKSRICLEKPKKKKKREKKLEKSHFSQSVFTVCEMPVVLKKPKTTPLASNGGSPVNQSTPVTSKARVCI